MSESVLRRLSCLLSGRRAIPLIGKQQPLFEGEKVEISASFLGGGTAVMWKPVEKS